MDHNGFFRKLWPSKSSNYQQPNKKSKITPSFKPSLFSNNSLASVSSATSPSSFYAGKIQYGGAMSAMRNSLSSPYVIPKIKKVHSKSKPSNSSDAGLSDTSGSLSSTAQKILQTLEKMSTPLQDLKKIPPPSFKVSKLFAGRQRKRPMGVQSLENSKRFCPPNTALAPVTPVVVSSSAKLPLDNNLSTQSLIKCISGSNENVATISPNMYKGKPGVIASFSSSVGLNLNKNNIQSSKSGGKMKHPRKNHAHYSNANTNEEMEPTNLPDVTFSVAKLPSFNFNQPDSTSTPAPPKPVKKPLQANSLELQYTFSPPAATSSLRHKMSKKTNVKVNFTSPLVDGDSKKVSRSPAEVNDQSSKLASKNDFGQTGSVMDILGKPNATPVTTASSEKPSLGSIFKKPSDKWECSVCMIMNDRDKAKCAACDAPNPQSKPALGSLFKKPNDKWECGVCMIMNDQDVLNCAACTEPKPGSKDDSSAKNTVGQSLDTQKPASSFKPSFVSNIDSFSSGTKKFSFGTSEASKTSSSDVQFKFGVDNSTKNNKETFTVGDNTACSKSISLKPETTSVSFGKSSSKWTCKVCLVPNENNRNTCVSCQDINPNKSISDIPSSSSFKFGKTSDAVLKFGANEAKSGSSSESTNVIASSSHSTSTAGIVTSVSINVSSPQDSSLFKSKSIVSTSRNATLASLMTTKSTELRSNDQSQKSLSKEAKEKKNAVLANQQNPDKPMSFGKLFSESSHKQTLNEASTQSALSSSTNQSDKAPPASVFSTFTATTVSATPTNSLFGQSKDSSISGLKNPSPKPTSTASISSFKSDGSFSAISQSSLGSLGQQPKAAFTNSPSQGVNVLQAASSLPKPTFSFGTKSDVKTGSPASKSFLFGSNQAANSSGGFKSASENMQPFAAFNQPNKSTANESSKVQGFSGFGQQAIKSQDTKADSSKPSNDFKSTSSNNSQQFAGFSLPTSSQSDQSSKIQSFSGFGQPAVKPPNTNPDSSNHPDGSTSSNKPSQFLGFGTKVDQSSKPPGFAGFGQQAFKPNDTPSDSISVKAPSFGGFGQPTGNSFNKQQTSDNSVAKLPGFGGFGQTSETSAAQAKSTFSFGSSAPSTSNFSGISSLPKPSFAFGKSDTDSKPQFGSGTNMFGSNAAATSATTKAVPGFQFGSTANPSQPQSNTTFGSSSTNPSQPQSNTPFGSTAPQTIAPPFGFGSNANSNPSSAFQFGGAQASSSSSTGFNFGSSSTVNKNPAPSAGFNFNSADSSAKPVFSGNAPFQFGSSQNQVNMQSGTASMNKPQFQFSANQQSFQPAAQPKSGSNMFSIGQSGRPSATRNVKQAKRRLRKKD